MSAPVNPLAHLRLAPPGFWQRAENRHAFLDWLGHVLHFRRPRDWYRLQAKHLKAHGGAVLLRWSGNSLVRILEDYLPEHDWKAWLFPRVPQGFWNQRENRVAFLDWVGEQLGYEAPEDWYQVDNAVLLELGSASAAVKVGGAYYPLMKDYMPDYDWKPWLFRELPPGYWQVRENRLAYLRWLGRELGFKKPEDWYNLSLSDLKESGGITLYNTFGSLAELVKAHFAEHDWLEWRFDGNLSPFWEDEGNCRRYLSWLGEKLGFRKADDWYALTRVTLNKYRGDTLYEKFGSMRAIVRFLYPDHVWLEWRFYFVPIGFWYDQKCRREYLDWLGKKLGFLEMDDWYALTYQDLAANYGSTLSGVYGGRLYLIVMENFPEHEWLEWRFFKTWDDFWEKRKNCLRYLDWLADRLGFSCVEDWYRVSSKDFVKNYGKGLLNRFGASYSTVLKFCYPNHQWKEWLFDKPPVRFWNEKSNRSRYLDWLGKKLGYRRTEDWYQFTHKQLVDNRGEILAKKLGGVVEILREYRPDFDWKEWLLPVIPKGFWRNPQARRRYLSWLGEELGYESPQDWCRLTPSHLKRGRGRTLLEMYSFSVDAVLRSAFPANHPIVLARRRHLLTGSRRSLS